MDVENKPDCLVLLIERGRRMDATIFPRFSTTIFTARGSTSISKVVGRDNTVTCSAYNGYDSRYIDMARGGR